MMGRKMDMMKTTGEAILEDQAYLAVLKATASSGKWGNVGTNILMNMGEKMPTIMIVTIEIKNITRNQLCASLERHAVIRELGNAPLITIAKLRDVNAERIADIFTRRRGKKKEK